MKKLIVCTLSASLPLLAVANVAIAKGPKGNNGPGISTHGASNSPQGQALGQNSWSGSAPGWSSGSKNGWDGGEPPGWDKNTKGQINGWDGATAPGLGKRAQ